MTAIQLSSSTTARLKGLEVLAGRAASDCVQEAVEKYLDDREDVYWVGKALEDIRRGAVDPISLDEMSKRLGLYDPI